jgi:hypothetical protein
MKTQRKRHGIATYLDRLSPVARREFVASGWTDHTDRKREALRPMGRIPARLCRGLDRIACLVSPGGTP